MAVVAYVCNKETDGWMEGIPLVNLVPAQLSRLDEDEDVDRVFERRPKASMPASCIHITVY